MGYFGAGLEKIKQTPPRKYLKFSNAVYILHLVQSFLQVFQLPWRFVPLTSLIPFYFCPQISDCYPIAAKTCLCSVLKSITSYKIIWNRSNLKQQQWQAAVFDWIPLERMFRSEAHVCGRKEEWMWTNVEGVFGLHIMQECRRCTPVSNEDPERIFRTIFSSRHFDQKLDCQRAMPQFLLSTDHLSSFNMPENVSSHSTNIKVNADDDCRNTKILKWMWTS